MTSAEPSERESARLAVFDTFAFLTETENETLTEICQLTCGLFSVDYAQITLIGADRCHYLTRTVAQRSFLRKGSFTDRVFGCSGVTKTAVRVKAARPRRLRPTRPRLLHDFCIAAIVTSGSINVLRPVKDRHWRASRL